MSADEPEVDPEVITWAALCYERTRYEKPKSAHDLNVAHLRLRLRDPAYARSAAGRRALRTIENLLMQVAA